MPNVRRRSGQGRGVTAARREAACVIAEKSDWGYVASGTKSDFPSELHLFQNAEQ